MIIKAFKRIVVISLWLHFTVSCIFASTVIEQKDEESVEEYLNGLSVSELEEICTSRGFSLQPEEGFSKDEYTHEDYVDAAIQCLAIEAEIEAAIEENPEILDQLKEEAERMQQEKEELEAELLRLLKESSDSEKDVDDESGRSHHAFINDDDHENLDERKINDEEELQKSQETVREKESEFNEDVIADQPESLVNNDSNGYMKKINVGNDDSNFISESEAGVSLTEKQNESNTSIITIYDFVQEFRRQVLQDINRVLEFVEPVATPLIKVLRATILSAYASMSDMTKRYSKIISAHLSSKDKGENSGGNIHTIPQKVSEEPIQ